MNRRVNIYLNVYSFISFLLATSNIELSLTLEQLSFEMPSIIKISSSIFGMISILIFVSIEVLLFLILNKKTKYIDSIIFILTIMLIIYLNKKINFIVFFLVPLYCLIKSIIRILLVKKIYEGEKFKKYCKMFNLKIKDFPKKRKVEKKPKTKKEHSSISSEDSVYV